MSISVVIPVYNEADNIVPLAEELSSVADRLDELEVLFVDDGSSDRTWERLCESAEKHPWLKAIHYDSNRGQCSAILIGLSRARGDILVTMDGDRQNYPADIPTLIDEMQDFDVVCGYRANRKDTWARRKGSLIANWVRNKVTNDNVRDTGCSLKAFKKYCIEDLPHIDGVHRFMPAYFHLNGRTIKEIPVDHRARTHGSSKYTNIRRLPQTVYDLFGFVWYRKRHLKRLNDSDLTATG